MRSTFKLVCLTVAIISVSGCGGTSPKATPVPATTATANPSVAATPTNAASPTPAIPGYARDKRTGDAQLDSVVDAVLSGDVSRVKPLLRFYAVGCVTASTGFPTPPLCASGAPVGTPIEVFPNASCGEGRFNTRADIDVFLPVVSNSSSRLFAVYRQAPKPPADTGFPLGAFGIVLTTPSKNGPGYSVSRLEVDAGQIVLAGVLCPSDTAQQVLDNLQARDFVLPPPQ